MENDNKKKPLFKIISIILWIILFVWMSMVIVDYYKTVHEKEPMFCIKRKTTNYTDGTVESCTGLLYKVYHYNRKSFKAVEFGPFWSKDRSNK